MSKHFASMLSVSNRTTLERFNVIFSGTFNRGHCWYRHWGRGSGDHCSHSRRCPHLRQGQWWRSFHEGWKRICHDQRVMLIEEFNNPDILKRTLVYFHWKCPLLQMWSEIIILSNFLSNYNWHFSQMVNVEN